MYPIGSCVDGSPQLVVLFCEVVETLTGEVYLGENRQVGDCL
jgi:hypothetical protein